MKRHKKYLLVCTAACSLLLGGCGESLHEMTAEEEDLIVHYAAYVVAKHNIQQKDGMSNVFLEEEEQVSEKPTDSEQEELPEDTSETEGTAAGTPAENNQADSMGISLADAIGHGENLAIACTGGYVTDNYVEGAAYSIDAATGKTFYVMEFELTNITQEDVQVENLTKGLAFRMTSGELSVKSEVTFLTTDFSTYCGTIPAGQSVKTVLLFEIPDTEAESVAEPNLQIITDKETKNIKM